MIRIRFFKISPRIQIWNRMLIRSRIRIWTSIREIDSDSGSDSDSDRI